jgi:exosortase C (VPDSG-CTERM-specific)
MPEKTAVSSTVLPGSRRGLKAFIGFALVLAVCYGRMLYDLVVFAVHSDLYSYVLLIPFVSAYLVKLKWKELDLTSVFERRYAVIPLAAGATLLIGYWYGARRGWTPVVDDYFALMTVSLLCFLLADAWIFFGGKNLRKLAFPIAFLFFSVPFPTGMRAGIESFLQHASADVAAAMLKVSGMPVLQEGTYFRLPGIRLDVAPECSGIRSSVILFITGLVAAYIILNSNWRRVVLVAAMVPLALLRNGFRIFTISQLCVHFGLQMIDSPIHRRGGPIFFGLSMIPFLFLLIYLRKKELKTAPKQPLPNE